MTKWIRWWGLGVFLALITAFALLWLLAVDGLVKSKIQEEGTRAMGAKVELDHANLTLFPTGLALTRLQITNPDEPMTNAMEIAHISMALDILNLLRRKIIVDQMKIEGMKFGTARTSSGAISDRPQESSSLQREDSAEDMFSLPPFEVPDIQKILEEEDLETLKLIETIQTDIQRETELWKVRLKNLPGKEQLAKYQRQIEKLKSSTKGGVSGILRGVEGIKSIQKDIEDDLKQLKEAQRDFEDMVALLKKRVAQAKTAPQKDVRRLEKKYAPSPQGFANLGQTLLGNHIGPKLKQGVKWYEKLKPYLEKGTTTVGTKNGETGRTPIREKGIDIRFKEFQPLPDFLIRKAKASLILVVGEVSGEIENITSDQAVLDSPLTFQFSGDRLKGLQGLTLLGTFDHRSPTLASDIFQFQANGYRFRKVSLSNQPDWPVILEEGLGDMSFDVNVRGETLLAKGTSQLRSLRVLAGNAGDSNPLTKTLSSAVLGISKLSVQADVNGTIQKYEVALRSDLDSILKNAAGKMVQSLAASFSQDLQLAISAKVSDPLKSLSGSLSGLDAIGGDLTNRQAKQKDLLKGIPGRGTTPQSLPDVFKLPF